VLSCRAASAEARLSFTALGDLLAPLEPAAFAVLPEPQRRALDAALLRGELGGPAPIPRAIGTGLVTLLSALAAEAPRALAIDDLHAFGARSMSVWTASRALVADTGDELERLTADPGEFNSDNAANNSFDLRSNDKGPEPEAVAIGKAFGRTHAFLGLERIGGVVVYDLSDPAAPRLVSFTRTTAASRAMRPLERRAISDPRASSTSARKAVRRARTSSW